MTEQEWIIQTLKDNSHHIEVINDELGLVVIRLASMEAKIDIALAILGIVGATFLTLFVTTIYKKIFANGKKRGE